MKYSTRNTKTNKTNTYLTWGRHSICLSRKAKWCEFNMFFQKITNSGLVLRIKCSTLFIRLCNSSLKQTLSKTKIAEIYIIEIKIADIKIIEIKIAEFFRSFITNDIYFNDLIFGDHFLRLLFKYLSYTWNLFTYCLKSTTDSCDYLNDGDKKTLKKVSLILVSGKSLLTLLLDIFQLSY